MSPSPTVADSDLITVCTPTQEYAERIIARGNERNWPLSNDQVWAVSRQLRPLSRLDPRVSLDIWLRDLPTTFRELWLWVADEWETRESGSAMLDSEFSLEPEQLRWLRSGRGQQLVGEISTRPAIRPVSLNLTTGHGRSVRHIRRMQPPAQLARLEVLVWLALNPQLIPYTGRLLPLGLWLPALECRPTPDDEWDHAPLIRRGATGEPQLIGQPGWIEAAEARYSVALRHEVGDWH